MATYGTSNFLASVGSLNPQLSLQWKVIALGNEEALEGIAQLSAREQQGGIRKNLVGITYPFERKGLEVTIKDEDSYFYGPRENWNENSNRARSMNIEVYLESNTLLARPLYKIPLQAFPLPTDRIKIAQYSISYLKEH